ncbi:hypothetical protein ONE63_011606 [Megalurothrips usitatus]|uniref:Nuclease HARBI1 n=1 Tax=Megalurothrips usitatus TaxID=439358 RepID=A0AAV7X3V0_9NEOP|nr:hypothetical protein ONE63_011606 [Megalurothrips usitatus]
MKRKRLLGIMSAMIDVFEEDDDILLSLFALNQSGNPVGEAALLVKGERKTHFRLGHLTLNLNDWIGLYLDADFHFRFRMKKDTFWALVEVIRPHYPKKWKRGDAPLVDCPKAVLMTLSYLGHQTSMDDIGDRFGVAVSTVHKEVHRIAKIICSLKSTFIIWPKANECTIIEQQFRERAGFPGVIGAIDGCHVEIVAPADDQVSYTDRKMNHSIILQGICTASKIFTNVSIGTPGSRNDNRALALSSIFKQISLKSRTSVFYEDRFHLVGDKAYPNRCWLLAPFKNYGNLTRRQRKYNYHHSVTRIVIEHTFGLLKGRWRRLLGLVLKDVAKDTDFVLAGCILHNFCYLHQDTVINDMVENVHMVQGAQVVGVGGMDALSKARGDQKREEICNLF